MGENNAAWNRKNVLHHKTVKAASEIYKGNFIHQEMCNPLEKLSIIKVIYESCYKIE